MPAKKGVNADGVVSTSPSQMTEKEALYYNFYCDFVEKNNDIPTMAQMADGTGKSKTVCYHMIKKLKSKGLLKHKITIVDWKDAE